MSMNLLRLFRSRNASAPVARERLQILLSHERGLLGQSDLLATLREEILAVVAKHVVLDPDKVIVKLERGKTVSTLEVDIEVPEQFRQVEGAGREAHGRLTMSAARPVLPMTGGCSCRAIRYEIASLPLLLYTCNCTDCQTASGSAFALNMPVRTRDFRILQGQPKGWRRNSPVWRGCHFMVLRRVRRAPLWRTPGPPANHEPARRDA